MDTKMMRIPTEELYEISEKYMAVICGYNREGVAAEKIRKNAMKVRDKVFANTTIDVLYSPFSAESIQGNVFRFDNTEIECPKLEKIDKDSILGGYAFMFHAPMPDISSLQISKVYLADSWQTSFVDVGRDFLREKFMELAKQTYSESIFITDTIAPGMFGIAGNKVKKFFEFMDGSKIGLEVMESGMMNPVKSFVGIFLILNQEKVIHSMNCNECLSNHKFCEYCKNYAQMIMD